MPEVHARIVETSPQARHAALAHMQDDNMKGIQFVDFTQDANLQRAPDYYVYIFNIAPVKREVRRPPSWPLITFAACPEGHAYALVGRVPSTVNEVTIVVDRTIVNGIRGERFATDLLNPANHGADIWKEITDDQISWIDGGTDDLTRRGMFWSRNEVPSEKELAMCRDRMERHYKVMLTQADGFFRENRQKEIGPEHRVAATYYNYKAPWHLVAEVPHFCPNCGDTIRPGVGFHMTPAGLCVIDWQKAVAAGVKTREDVPREMRWWKTPGRKPAGEVEEEEQEVTA